MRFTAPPRHHPRPLRSSRKLTFVRFHASCFRDLVRSFHVPPRQLTSRIPYMNYGTPIEIPPCIPPKKTKSATLAALSFLPLPLAPPLRSNYPVHTSLTALRFPWFSEECGCCTIFLSSTFTPPRFLFFVLSTSFANSELCLLFAPPSNPSFISSCLLIADI